MKIGRRYEQAEGVIYYGRMKEIHIILLYIESSELNASAIHGSFNGVFEIPVGACQGFCEMAKNLSNIATGDRSFVGQ